MRNNYLSKMGEHETGEQCSSHRMAETRSAKAGRKSWSK